MEYLFPLLKCVLKCSPVISISILLSSFSFQKLIGSPDDASLGFLRSDNAKRYMKQLPQFPRQDFRLRFRNMSAGAVDLLERMLVFDPSRRITGTWVYRNHFISGSFNIYSNTFFSCSWWGSASPILGFSSWYQWRTYLPCTFQLWFWATIVYRSTYKRTHLEGIFGFQPGSSLLRTKVCIVFCWGLRMACPKEWITWMNIVFLNNLVPRWM